MILSIGEILVDLIGEEKNGITKYGRFCGGAPFNVAVNAKQSGAKTGFIGRVGKDPFGKFIKDYANKVGFEYLNIQEDEERNTTLAVVSLTNGERDFAFFRHDTADFNIDENEIDLNKYEDLTIVHLGSLMLSEEKGQKFASSTLKKIREANKMFSFDVNFRKDLYGDIEQAKKAYKPYIDEADILKFSDDEIFAYTGESALEKAVNAVEKENRLLLVTLGSCGSMYKYNGLSGFIPTEKVIPVDTTGAGDAFFGTTLANLDGKEFTEENIEKALIKGNEAGAKATLFKGAIKL